VRRGLSLTLLAVVLCGCDSRQPRPESSATSCPPAALEVAQRFASHMRQVSVLGPDTVVARELTTAYDGLASPELLTRWQADTRHAPGRDVSNPWPARIEIRDTSMSGSACRVEGDLLYVSTSDTMTSVERRPVTLELRDDGGWRVTAFEAPAGSAPPTGRDSAPAAGGSNPAVPTPVPPRGNSDTTAQAVVRNYYAAIDARRYADAYALWSRDGAASGKSLAEFTKGFAETKSVRATVSDSIQVEGAAGSQYATVPVTVDAVLNDGATQHFTGTYTLRRAMVDGATAQQRAWHIYSARLSPSR
jgi:hypothetical protein